MIKLSSEARNLNWLVSNFVDGVPGVNAGRGRVVRRAAHRDVRRSRPGRCRSPLGRDRRAAQHRPGRGRTARWRRGARGRRRVRARDAVRDEHQRDVGARGVGIAARATSVSSATRWPSWWSGATPRSPRRSSRSSRPHFPDEGRAVTEQPPRRPPRLVRPYVLTKGRTRAPGAPLALEASIDAQITPGALPPTPRPSRVGSSSCARRRRRSPSWPLACCSRSGWRGSSSPTSSPPTSCSSANPPRREAATDVSTPREAARWHPRSLTTGRARRRCRWR